jgi:hypothetical protein
MAEERHAGQESIALGTRTDSYELHFPRELKVKSAVLAVGHEQGRPALQVTYAVSGQGLEPVPTDRGPVYVLRLRFVATAPDGHVVATLDTTRRLLAAQPVPPTEHLVGRVAVPVGRTGMLSYRLAVQQGGDMGIVLPRDSVRVEAPTPGAGATPQLTMSDIVLGSRRVPLLWSPTETDTVFMNPLRTFMRTDAMQLYYEIHGLAPGTPFTTQLVVKKADNPEAFKKLFGGSSAISLKFADQAQTADVAIQRSVNLERLKPGLYILGIAITDAAGRTDWRQQPFQVVEK